MKFTTEVIEELNKILIEKEPVRKELIKCVQNKIWNDESINDESLNEILTGLAYDLDFYEPNEDWRKEDSSYYGGERLETLIKSCINRIGNYHKAAH